MNISTGLFAEITEEEYFIKSNILNKIQPALEPTWWSELPFSPAWPPSENPPPGWERLPFNPPWPIPSDYFTQPIWWRSPPFPTFPDTAVVGEHIACKLMDEATQKQ